MVNRKVNFIIAWQVILTCLFLLGWTYTLKTNTPAGTDDPTEADDRMREIKAALIERLDKTLYFYPSATSTYDAADTGKNRFVIIRDANDISSVDDNEFVIQTKEVGGIKELHLMDEDENEFQLTSAGTLNIVEADLLGTLTNNTYFTTIDQAGTGTVNLIKANASDVAVIPDGSELATSGAPTADADIANKKYVDDQLANEGIQAWVNFTGRDTNGACTVNDSYGVTSVTRRANSCYDIVFSTAFANDDYVVVSTAHHYGSRIFIFGASDKTAGAAQTVNTVYLQCCDWNSTLVDPDTCWILAIGDQ